MGWIKRGDLITVAMQGDSGKSRPVPVVPADSFDGLPVITAINWRFFVRCAVILIHMTNDAVSLIPPFPECSI